MANKRKELDAKIDEADTKMSDAEYLIKTNEQKVPSSIDKPSVLRQLVCSGVMAALEVRRAGFPTRVTYKEVGRARPHRIFIVQKC